MRTFETKPKKWGNSLGITLPRDIVKAERLTTNKKIKVMVMTPPKRNLEEIFGTLKMKKPTQQMMDEIDEGYD